LSAGRLAADGGLTQDLSTGPDETPSILQETTVAAVCDICGKGPGFGNNVSHSHRRTRRRFDPNIQRVRATVNGAPKRLNVCTSCLKAGKVTR
jgi:large subunit ribosomal protein L28